MIQHESRFIYGAVHDVEGDIKFTVYPQVIYDTAKSNSSLLTLSNSTWSGTNTTEGD